MDALQPVWGIASLILAGIGALALLAYGARRRRRFLNQWFAGDGAATDVSPEKRRWRGALLVACLAFASLALARPRLLDRTVPEAAAGDVVLLVDCSRSMLATDVAPSRFEMATSIARELVRRAPASRFALVAFAGEAFTECPPTHDREAVLRYLERLTCESIPLPGTSFAPALAEALRLLEPVRPAALILLSDGEETAPAGEMPSLPGGVALLAIGVGNPALASPIPASGIGQSPTTRPDFAAIEEWADEFLVADDHTAESASRWLRRHFAGTATDAKQAGQAAELYPWLVLGALLCLLSRWLIDERRIVAALAFLALLATVRAGPSEAYGQGLALLDKQSFAEAVVLWRELARLPGADTEFQAAARLNLGVALHRLGRQMARDPGGRSRAPAAFAEAEACYRACLWNEAQRDRAARNLARLEQDRERLDPAPPEPAESSATSQNREPSDESPTPRPGIGETAQPGEGEGEATARREADRELTAAETAAALAAMRGNEGDFNEALRRRAARTWRTAPPERPW